MSNRNGILQNLIISLFMILLVREWLNPLTTISDTGEVNIFLGAFVYLVMVELFVRWVWVRVLLRVVVVVYVMHTIFVEIPVLSADWIRLGIRDILANLSLLFTPDMLEMSPFSRTFFFLLFLLLAESICFFWLVIRKKGLWFVVLTISYLAILDTFTPYNADGAIIRSLIYGFVLLSLLHLSKITQMFRERQQEGKWLLNWLVSVFIIVSLMVGVAFAAPKTPPSWPDPVSWVQSKAKPEYRSASSAGGPQKVGYDEDDSRLGGPFVQDDAVVFRADIEEAHYWRGESKDTYDGHGWFQSEAENSILPMGNNGVGIPEPGLNQNLETYDVTDRVEMRATSYRLLFYGGDPSRVLGISPFDDFLNYNRESGKIMKGNRGVGGVNGYMIQSKLPVLRESDLKKAAGQYEASIEERYLQLPESLPQRVKDLASEITEGIDSPYEKAREIESYLKFGPFRYETEFVPVPGKDEDFVDKFLFESRVGYCDHFSSSMVILARSAGVPARWVKGFTEGERLERIDSGTGDGQGNESKPRYLYEIRNKNAHSWVEVFIPGYGWIPFEPTKGFSQPIEIEYDFDTSETNQDNQEDEREDSAEEDKNQTPFWKEWKDGITSFFQSAAGLLANMGILLLLLVLAYVWWKRKELHLRMIQYLFLRTPGHFQAEKAFYALFMWFHMHVRRKQQNETLREYMENVSQETTMQDHLSAVMQQITEGYEAIRYGRTADEHRLKLYDLMKDVVRQLRKISPSS